MFQDMYTGFAAMSFKNNIAEAFFFWKWFLYFYHLTTSHIHPQGTPFPPSHLFLKQRKLHLKPYEPKPVWLSG